MEDHGIGRQQFSLLGGDVRSLEPIQERMPGLRDEGQPGWVCARGEILLIVDGFPPHPVQIRLQHLMPLQLQRLPLKCPTSCRVTEVGSGCAWTMSIFRFMSYTLVSIASSLEGWRLSSKLKCFLATIHRMDTRRLDLNLLVTLEALAGGAERHLAAARLHLSQPAVSAQLNRLRKLFDDPLLIPAQRGMTPTARALELLEPLRQALDQVRAHRRHAQHFQSRERQTAR